MNIAKKMFAAFMVLLCLLFVGCFNNNNRELVGVWVCEWGQNSEITKDGKIHFLDDSGNRINSYAFTLERYRLSIPALDTLEMCTSWFTFENGVLYEHAEGETTQLTRKR